MRTYRSLFILPVFIFSQAVMSQNSDSLTLRRLYTYYLTEGKTYTNLKDLCTNVGARLSGSALAGKAVQWAKKAMYEAGADTVILQPCMVTHWVRGQKEKCTLSSATLKTPVALNCLALGSSMGTGHKGIKAPVIEVKSFDELETLGEKGIKGRVVFYNVYFNQSHIRTGSAYGDAVAYRVYGASRAAQYGAVATLVRSMTSVADDEPHTGNMRYDTLLSKNKIASVAISYKAADVLHETIRKDPNALVYLETHCQTLPDVLSYNVVGQINGHEKPNEFISAGGHLDSWDVGQGAHDDGAGIVQCIELLAAYKTLGIKPRHSIRAVAFMNEENGAAGGAAYAAYAREHKEIHITALETDAGGYTPRGFGADTAKGLYAQVIKWQHLFSPYFTERVEKEGGGTDLTALENMGVPCLSLEPDSQRYFDIHHTHADTFDKINKRELDLGAGAIGALIYLIDKHYK